MENNQSEDKNQIVWQKSSVANFVRLGPSAMYFARARFHGKLIVKSLKTDVLGTAKLRLSDFVKQEREKAGSLNRSKSGKC